MRRPGLLTLKIVAVFAVFFVVLVNGSGMIGSLELLILTALLTATVVVIIRRHIRRTGANP
jgi:hypothetical protein